MGLGLAPGRSLSSVHGTILTRRTSVRVRPRPALPHAFGRPHAKPDGRCPDRVHPPCLPTDCIPTPFWVFPPVLHVNTASYDDNTYMLWMIKMWAHQRNPDMTHAFVVGDEQTFQRMIHMKEMEKVNYEWLIPMPGEFHVAAHMLHCEYRLYWNSILSPIVELTGKKHIKGDHKVEDFNVHEIFYLTVVQAVWEFVEGLFPDMMDKPRQLMNLVKGNMTLRLLCDFLFHGAVPYMEFRRLVREPPCKENRRTMNKIYRLYAWRYKAMNKTNYSPLCFHAAYMFENLTEPLQNLWCKIYNASLKGHPGRHMALDATGCSHGEGQPRSQTNAIGQRYRRENYAHSPRAQRGSPCGACQ